ncbi:hypothetical protein PV677_35990 [Streptomyces sp. DE06-01C]|uniref:hypothetical protein n=1 Tax=Streptomyces sp. DE06-01C TaxID=3028656 RepID=UPI0029C5556A|nr:hypothetical protein [Streptomyces sp. DE06-01C]MDX5526072.1 hypothetical protein [Streptomyces sp. DE06-01C]
MNDFQPYSYTDSVTADRPWLASLVGVQDTNTITLDLTKFVEGTHYTVSANPLLQGRTVMKSGVPLGKVTASGLYAPYAGLTSEVQTVTVTGTPTGGTYTLTYSGQTTAAIPYNATAAQVQTALEGLSNLAPGDVVAGGGPHPGSAVTVTFGGTLTGDDVAQMTASATNLTGGTTPAVTVTTTTAGGTAAASDGTQILAGFLVSEISFNPASTKAAGALLWHGEVFAGELPVPLNPANVTAVAPGVNIHYR